MVLSGCITHRMPCAAENQLFLQKQYKLSADAYLMKESNGIWPLLLCCNPSSKNAKAENVFDDAYIYGLPPLPTMAEYKADPGKWRAPILSPSDKAHPISTAFFSPNISIIGMVPKGTRIHFVRIACANFMSSDDESGIIGAYVQIDEGALRGKRAKVGGYTTVIKMDMITLQSRPFGLFPIQCSGELERLYIYQRGMGYFFMIRQR